MPKDVKATQRLARERKFLLPPRHSSRLPRQACNTEIFFGCRMLGWAHPSILRQRKTT